ncbi:MAG: TolC family protein [Tannerellaceae bacterium]
MNKCKLKRIVLGAAFFLLAVPIDGQERITINQCYEWAEANYPLIHRQGLIRETEGYNLANASRAWLPGVTLSAKASYQSAVTKLPFDAEKLAAVVPSLSIPVLPKDQYQAVAEVNQLLWDGGVIRSARSLTRAEAEADRKQLEADLYALRERVNQLYFGSLLQSELLRQNALLQEQLAVNHDRIAAMMTGGLANLSDLESIEVELLGARQQAIELTASRTAYLRMLAVWIGRPIDNPEDLAIPILPVEAYSTLRTITRPELHVFDARSHLFEVQNAQLTAALMPRFGLFAQGGYGRPGLNMLSEAFDAFYIAGVRMSWNLGRLYTLRDDRRKLDAARRGVEIQRETFLFNTRLQQTEQQTMIRKAQELMRADSAILRLRSNIREAAEVKLTNGVIATSDLIREINAESLARQTEATHRMQELMAVYTYLHTTGNTNEQE